VPEVKNLTGDVSSSHGTQRLDVDVPLCVDLDGTLVRTDTLVESLFAVLREFPLQAAKLPFWLIRGLPYAKQRIQSIYRINVEQLPYNQDVLEFLNREKSKGRRIILITASTEDLAARIADHLQCFDEAHGTHGAINLKGSEKARYLIERFGAQGFDYLGDSRADIPVWEQARTPISVHPEPLKVGGRKIEHVPDSRRAKNPAVLYAKTMRLHQWVKNVLIAVPLLASHRIFDAPLLLKCIGAMFALGCLASSTYILNDLFDLPADRKHRTKSQRPIPSGRVPLRNAIVLGLCLFVMGFFAAAIVSFGTLALSLLYVVCTVSYSMWLKRKLLVDTLMLAGLYTLRVLIGGAATQIPISFWLLAFSVFVFFSLAVVKRVIEISATPAGSRPAGRGYFTEDMYVLTDLGITSAFVATAVFALYINSSEVAVLYVHPKALWAICPVILYWFSRVWILAHRGDIHDDPIIFLFKDRISYLLAAISVVTLLIAKFGNLPEAMKKYITF
jgi:4-hydroxybenzoate polyprenyltransferase/phosphoserine phosphatase